MQHLFLSIYFAAVVTEMLIRFPFEKIRRRRKRIRRQVPPAEWLVLILLFLGMFFLPLAYALTPWLRFADYRWPPAAHAVAGVLGSAALLFALWLFWRAHRDLAADWSPSLEVFEGHRLVTEGIYGVIRHPMYASQVAWAIGQTLLLRNWIAGPASLVALLPLFLVRIPQEERMLVQHFGDDYRLYCERTGRIVPRRRQ